MTNPRYRPDGIELWGEECRTKCRVRFWFDDSQTFPDHIHMHMHGSDTRNEGSADLPRAEVERLRDWLTAWLERDPDGELLEQIDSICRSYPVGLSERKDIIAAVREYDSRE